jgi:hypothetical protein
LKNDNAGDPSNITYTWIETFRGINFDVKNPDHNLIHPEDIAHSLSLQCRFNGHCEEFYSVAEHCIRVHDAMAYDNHREEVRIAGLLHDASEAYLCDVPRPIKRALPGYSSLEENIQRNVWYRFNINVDTEIEYIVKAYDQMLLCAEAKQLMPSAGEDWGYDIKGRDIFIVPMLPNVARREFLHRLSLYGLY